MDLVELAWLAGIGKVKRHGWGCWDFFLINRNFEFIFGHDKMIDIIYNIAESKDGSNVVMWGY